jgi:DNA-binding IclR family transcriptional regulator
LIVPCVRPDGSLSSSGRALLKAVQKDSTPVEVAAATGMPLYRVRSALRELVAAGFVSETGEHFHQTEQGAAKAQSND